MQWSMFRTCIRLRAPVRSACRSLTIGGDAARTCVLPASYLGDTPVVRLCARLNASSAGVSQSQGRRRPSPNSAAGDERDSSTADFEQDPGRGKGLSQNGPPVPATASTTPGSGSTVPEPGSSAPESGSTLPAGLRRFADAAIAGLGEPEPWQRIQRTAPCLLAMMHVSRVPSERLATSQLAKELVASVCRQMTPANYALLVGLLPVLPLLNLDVWRRPESTAEMAARPALMATLCRFVERVLWLLRANPPDEVDALGLANLLALLQLAAVWPAGVQRAFRACRAPLALWVADCEHRSPLIDLVRLLTPGERLQGGGVAGACAELDILRHALDRLAVILEREDVAHWAVEDDALFSAACRTVSLHRFRHPGFLAAATGVWQRRVEVLENSKMKGAEPYLHPAVVVNFVFMVSFLGAESTPSSLRMLRYLMYNLALPPRSVLFAAGHSNRVTSYSEPGPLGSPHFSALDLLQLSWAAPLFMRRQPALLANHFRCLMESMLFRRGKWDAKLLYLVMQSLDFRDMSLAIPFYVCRTTSWLFLQPEQTELLRIVADIDDGAAGGNVRHLRPSRACTLGCRPGGLIAAFAAVRCRGDEPVLVTKPAESFEVMLEDLRGRIAERNDLSCGYVFQTLDKATAGQDDWEGLVPVMLLLVTDDHVLRPAGSGFSSAVGAQSRLLESWGNIVAVVTVAEVLRRERLGQRARDTCLLAMCAAARNYHTLHSNHRGTLAAGESPPPRSAAAASHRVPVPPTLA